MKGRDATQYAPQAGERAMRAKAGDPPGGRGHPPKRPDKDAGDDTGTTMRSMGVPGKPTPNGIALHATHGRIRKNRKE